MIIRCMAGIYQWSIILADTDFFQQLESVAAANLRGRLNRLSTFYQIFCSFLAPDRFGAIVMNFGILCKHFGTVTQCSVEPTVCT